VSKLAVSTALLCLWLARASFAQEVAVSGDMRYRYEYVDKAGSAAYWRQRIRARVSLKAAANENLTVKARVATGSDDPVSTNQSLGDSFSTKGWGLDQAYFDWTLTPNAEKKCRLLGGKMVNPFHVPSKSEVVWDGDLSPEGLAVGYGSPKSDGLFAAAGYFLLDEDGKHRDGEDSPGLVWAQVGVKKGGLSFGVGYFGYSNLKGSQVLADSTEDFGNTSTRVDVDPNGTPGDWDDYHYLTYDNDYTLVGAFLEYGTKLGAKELPLAFYVDVVANTAVDANDLGWAVGAKIGKKPWNAKAIYKSVEADAVVGAFTDSDFLGGGTDGDGFELGFGYHLAENAAVALTYFLNAIERGGTDTDYERLQLDLKLKF
jgi:hypothetical protein